MRPLTILALLFAYLAGSISNADCVPSDYSGRKIRYTLSRGNNCPRTITVWGKGLSLSIPELRVKSKYLGGGYRSFVDSYQRSRLGTTYWWSPRQPSKHFACSENLKELVYNSCYYREQLKGRG